MNSSLKASVWYLSSNQNDKSDVKNYQGRDQEGNTFRFVLSECIASPQLVHWPPSFRKDVGDYERYGKWYLRLSVPCSLGILGTLSHLVLLCPELLGHPGLPPSLPMHPSRSPEQQCTLENFPVLWTGMWHRWCGSGHTAKECFNMAKYCILNKRWRRMI